MGIVVVLMFYAVAMTVVATIAAAVFGATAAFLTRKTQQKRKAVLLASILFPYLCVCFAGIWFVCYATVNQFVFDRDPGLGDGWNTPLPNGYALMMIDVTDEGTVYNPRTQPGNGSVGSQPDTAFGVRELQVSGTRIFGVRDSGYFGRIGKDSKQVDTWFELDTSRNTQSEFKSLEELRKQAMSEGVDLNLRAFASVFGDYRNTWFDYFAGLILVMAPLAGFILLTRWVLRVRRKAVTP